jgi:large subunit ribosomal protein L31e
MKTPSKEADVEEELEKETEEEPEEELPIEEVEAEEELEETEEKVEEEVLEEEIEEPIEEEIVEEEVLEEAIEEEEEEEKPERREREEIEEEIVEERIYTIPLGRAWISPPKKRAPRAIRIIRGFIIRHMKIKTAAIEEEAERLVISNEVNEKIWSSGIKKPPRKIRVRAVKDKEGTVTLHLAEGD